MKKILPILSLLLFFTPSLASASVILGTPNMTSLSSGLVGYWPLDGATTNWTKNQTSDLSGNGNTGTLVGMSTTTSSVAGKIGGALKFPEIAVGGHDPYVNVPYAASIDFSGKSQITISAWYYSTVSKSDNFMIYHDSTNPTGYLMELSSGQLDCQIGNGAAIPQTADPATSLGKWHLATCVRDGVTQKLYKDGVLVSSTSNGTGGTLPSTVTGINIGFDHPSRDFDGKIDDVRIYNRALSAQEVVLLYAAGSAHVATANTVTLTSGLVGYWPLDGSTTNWTTNKTSDLSGNGNTGTLFAFSTTTSPVAGKIGGAIFYSTTAQGIRTSSVPTTAVDNVTLSEWVYWKGSSAANVLAYNGNSGLNGYGIFISNGSCSAGNKVTILLGQVACNALASTPYTLPSNRWVHLVISRNNGTWFLYANGVFVISNGVGIGAPNTPTAGFGIGTDGIGSVPSVAFNGAIDDVRIYNRALSAQQIQQLYAEGVANIGHANTVSLSSGLVGYWPLDGATTNWTKNQTSDLSGQGNTGTLVSMSTTTSPVAGKIGGALKLNGSSSYIDTPSLQPSLPITASAWIYVTSLTNNGGIIETNPTGTFYTGVTFVVNTNGSLSTTIGDNSSCSSFGRNGGTTGAGVISTGKWYHVATVANAANNMLIYVNGVSQSLSYSGTASSMANSSSHAAIGKAVGCGATPTTYFAGSIDDARLYSRALSAQQVQQLYSMGR